MDVDSDTREAYVIITTVFSRHPGKRISIEGSRYYRAWCWICGESMRVVSPRESNLGWCSACRRPLVRHWPSTPERREKFRQIATDPSNQ